MKVAYLVPNLSQTGGWRSHARAFLDAMRSHVDPVLYVSRADLSAAQQIFPGDMIIPLPSLQEASYAGKRGPFRLAQTYWFIRHSHPPQVDLVHSLEAFPTGLVGSWLAERIGAPLALTIHGSYGILPYEHRLNQRAYCRVLQGAKLICPVSHGTARLLQAYFGPWLADATIHPILNGNDFYQQVPRQEALARSMPAIPTILTVGDIKPRKGQDLSLAAFARVKQELPQARYRIVGRFKQDTYYWLIQDLINRHGLQDVELTGRVSAEELRRQYREASLFVLTPRQDGLHFEGFGLVYLEAGAYGLPVVATRSGGVPDAVREEETGLLANPEDVEGIAQAMLRLLCDPDLNRQMGQANRDWAETLTWQRTAQEQVAQYRKLLQGVAP